MFLKTCKHIVWGVAIFKSCCSNRETSFAFADVGGIILGGTMEDFCKQGRKWGQLFQMQTLGTGAALKETLNTCDTSCVLSMHLHPQKTSRSLQSTPRLGFSVLDLLPSSRPLTHCTVAVDISFLSEITWRFTVPIKKPVYLALSRFLPVLPVRLGRSN